MRIAVQGRHCVFRQPCFRPFRRMPGEQGVKGSPHRIKVAPGAYVRLAQGLFRGGVPLGGQDGGGVQLQGVARRAEVNENGRPLFRQQDIAGLDVPVVNVAGVQVFQDAQKAGEQAFQLVLRVAVAGGMELFPQIIQGQARDVLHGEVGRAVGLEHGQDSDDARMIQFRQGLGFAQKALQGPGVVLQVVFVVGPDMAGQRVAVGTACGEILLDHYIPVQEQVFGQIGNAEASASQDTENFILLQPRAGSQLPLIDEKCALFLRMGKRGPAGQNLFQACRRRGRRSLPCRRGRGVCLAFFCWHGKNSGNGNCGYFPIPLPASQGECLFHPWKAGMEFRTCDA